MASQLTLALSLRDEATFANYYPGRNQHLINYLQRFLQGEAESFIYLWGNSNVGLSHLLQACCQEMIIQQRTVFYLPLTDSQLLPDACENLESFSLVCIDDLQAIAKNPAWEEALFHLFNRIIAGKNRLIVTAKCVPSELELGLEDLRSRMVSSVIFQVHELTDAEKIIVVKQRANQRGMILNEEVARFLLQHYPRNLFALSQILDRLDKESLIHQRRLTIPFIREVLG